MAAPLLAGLILLLVMAPLPLDALERRWPALAAEIQNLGHPLLFGLLSHLVLARLRARYNGLTTAHFVWVLAGSFVFGLGTEAAQTLVDGRDASLTDLLNDMLGAGAAALLNARSGRAGRQRRLLSVSAAIIALLVISPLAVTIAAYASRSLAGPGVMWRAGMPLAQRFAHWQGAPFPGLVVDEPIADWRAWSLLEIEVESLHAPAAPVHVRVHDLAHEGEYRDRFNETFEIPAGARTVLQIPVSRIGSAPVTRRMDLAAVRGIIVFAPGGDAPGFAVHEVRLVR